VAIGGAREAQRVTGGRTIKKAWWKKRAGGEEKTGKQMIFGQLSTQNCPPSMLEIQPYLYKVEEGHLFFIRNNSWPLIQPIRIRTVGSKMQS
jgi:hypothetical protein